MQRKSLSSIYSATLIVLLMLHTVTFSQIREQIELRNGWTFASGNHPDAIQTDFDDSGWEKVVIPHDWAIVQDFIPDGDGNTGKLPWKGEGWYRHELQLPAGSDSKRFFILFDGVMAFPEVFVNGKLVGKWDYGYNSFYFDITSFLNHNTKNVVAVHADTRNHRSRWYSGAGIYRKVKLLVTNNIHIDVWGATVSVPVIKPHSADVRVGLRISNHLNESRLLQIKHSIFSPAGFLVKEQLFDSISLRPGSNKAEATFTLTDPQRWDIDQPVLYKYVVELIEDEVVTDRYETSFGIREMRFTADHGFYLNDRRVQLKGVNLHHDHGPLGAAFNYRAMERQLEIMKAMGVNAVRGSHNIPVPELLDLCDKMGLLVFNEAFDKYDATADITDSTDFEHFVDRNIRNFVRRDANHPSVFLWSAGNEIPDVQWNINRGFDKLNTVVNAFRKYDPSRPVTLVCDSYESAALRHFDLYDIHSWNYGRRYRLARQMEPNKAVIISESASTVSTRGFYALPLPQKPTDFTKDLQVSSYDLNAPEWAELADDDFMWQQEEPYVAGEFVWTGFDYLGEPTPYTNEWAKANGLTDLEASRSSYFGIVDLCGIPKDRYFLYKSYWNKSDTTIHLLPHWNWKGMEGKNVPVFVYTSGDCAELFVNGKSQGLKCKQPTSKNSVERFRLMWKDVVYQPGELKVIAYKEGVEIGQKVVQTAKDPYQIVLTPDRTNLTTDGEDLSYILVEARDINGHLCPLAMDKISLKLEGEGRLAGVCNGDPQSLVPFRATTIPLFYGKAMILLQSHEKEGFMKLIVTSNNMKEASTVIEVTRK